MELADVTVRIDAETADWAREEARSSGLPHNDARAVFAEILIWALTERAISRIGKGWLTRSDREAWEQVRTDLTAELVENSAFTAALDTLWPILTAKELLTQLFTSPARLRAAGADEKLLRQDGDAWTVSDVPLLDELVDMLGRDKPVDQSAERERRDEAAYAAGVLDMMISREDLMDDEDHLLAQDMLYAEDLADRFVERDTRELAERAAADRDWTYRHIVVDEAQEPSEMDWRVLMRRCPDRSFTVVGDLAQRRSPAGARSWATMMEPYVPGRWIYRSLSVNYRTPAEIMSVAAALLAEFAPGVQPPSPSATAGWRRGPNRSRPTNWPPPSTNSIRTRLGAKVRASSSDLRMCPAPCRFRKQRVWSSMPYSWWNRNESSPTVRVARRNSMSPSPAPPNVSASCTRGYCRRP